MSVYTSFAVFIFFAIALIVPSGFSVGPVLLVLGSLVLLRARRRSQLTPQDHVLIAVLAAYFILYGAMNVFQGVPGREYDAPIRFLLVIPALLLLMEYQPSPFAIWGGLAAGAIGSGVFSIWQSLILSYERAEGFTNPIQYGNISLLLGILCLAGLAWAGSQRRAKAWTMLLATGMVLGTLGSVFTGSRGSWLALPFCLCALALQYRHSWKPSHLVYGGIIAILAMASLYAIPRTSVKERIGLALTETHLYADKHNASTSVGARLEMWRTGIMLIKQRPALGWSKQGYMNDVQQLIHEGKIDPVVGDHSHLHNEYIDTWVKRGILGLIAVLALYLVPLYLFLDRFRNGTKSAKAYAMAGILLGLCYIVFGLTQAFLTHINGVMLYLFTLAILWTKARAPVNSQPTDMPLAYAQQI